MHTITYRIPAPPQNNSYVIYEDIVMTRPDTTELPLANDSHFSTLLDRMEVNEIVDLFTCIIFEESVLLVADETDLLFPIAQALN